MIKNQLSAKTPNDPEYDRLLQQIGETYEDGRRRAAHAVSSYLTQTYWQIGHDIIEFEQNGKRRAEYGKELLKRLSRDLNLRYGRGFSRSNLIYMRLLYLNYPISQMPSDLLSWSHYVELLRIEDPQHQDIGQMNMYLGYFAAEENAEGDNPPIGIILSREKDELLVEYATYEMNGQLFVQKYHQYLPNRDELRRELENTLRIAEQRSQQEEPS